MNQPDIPSSPDNSVLPAVPAVRGLGAWVAVVRAYQACADVLTARLKPMGLSLAQFEVLMALLRQPNQSQQQLAAASFVTKGHMSAVLADMVAAGWLSRASSEVDKRNKVVSLTPAGHALACAAGALQAEVVNAMMAPLTDAQVAELKRMSEQAGQALQALA